MMHCTMKYTELSGCSHPCDALHLEHVEKPASQSHSTHTFALIEPKIDVYVIFSCLNPG